MAGKVEVNDSTLNELFDLIRQNTAAINEVDKNVCVLHTKLEEKDKACLKHDQAEEKQNNRLTSLEIWRAEQSGVWNVVWKVAPLAVSCAAVYVAYLSTHKG